jgi:hypothetical protein
MGLNEFEAECMMSTPGMFISAANKGLLGAFGN